MLVRRRVRFDFLSVLVSRLCAFVHIEGYPGNDDSRNIVEVWEGLRDDKE